MADLETGPLWIQMPNTKAVWALFKMVIELNNTASKKFVFVNYFTLYTTRHTFRLCKIVIIHLISDGVIYG